MQVELFLTVIVTVLLPFSGIAILIDRTLNRRYSRNITATIWIGSYVVVTLFILMVWMINQLPDSTIHDQEYYGIVRVAALFSMFIMLIAETAVTCFAYGGKLSARVFTSLLMSTLCFTLYTLAFSLYHVAYLLGLIGPDSDTHNIAVHLAFNIAAFMILYRIMPARLANVITKAGGDMSRRLGFPIIIFAIYVLDYSDQIYSANMTVSSLLTEFLLIALYVVCMVLFLERTTGSLEVDRYKTELEAAALIQRSVVPDRVACSDVVGFRVFEFMLPAKEVGGDLYDVIPLSDDRTALVIADVSGKGVPAALMAMRVKEIMLFLLESGLDPGRCLTECNKRLMKDNDSCMFATAFLCVADPRTKTLTYSCAGHPAPLLRTGSGVTLMEVDHEPALGIFENDYSNRSIGMGAGDAVLMYTDGVIEAEGWNKERYGTDRLVRLLEESDDEDITSAVASDVSSFGEGRDQTDDITMLSIVAS